MPAIAAADPINIPASVSPNSLYISPNPCITGGSGTCAVNIVAEVASSTTVTHREIWVGDPVAGTFKLMNCDRAGMVSTSSASWVKLGVSYEFRLYPTSGCPKIIPAGYPLASVTVTGVGQAPTFPSPNVGLNKMDLASQYGGYGSHGDGSEADAAIGTRLAQKSIIDAKRTGAKFLRVAVAGFGPQWKGGMPGLLNLWQSNPNAYWAHVDKMMADLDASGIGIVPSFAFNQLEIPSMTGETLSDMVKNPNSASYTLLKQFVTQFITRYKNDPAMYFYETGNEMSNSADVDIVASCSTQYGAGARECNAKGNISTNDMIGYSTRLSTLQATRLINDSDAVIIDIRDQAQFAAGHIINAKNIPAKVMDERKAEIDKLKGKPVIVSCDTGTRASAGADKLRALGLTEVFTLQGGLNAWRDAGLPVSK